MDAELTELEEIDAGSLEAVANVCAENGLITIALQAQLLRLDDITKRYLPVGLHEYDGNLDRHVVESHNFGEDHPLLDDSWMAISVAHEVLIIDAGLF